jgi:predicted transcriptional regulator of viral defense system
MYEFVPTRVGAYPSGDELRDLEAIARAPKAPAFQVALGSAAFLRGYADTSPSTTYVLFDKNAGVRPPRLMQRFRVIRTDPGRIFGAEPIGEGSHVPVSTASRLYIDAALFWQHAGDLRVRDHWLAAAAPDVDPVLTSEWARRLGRNTVVRVGFLAERFGAAPLASVLLPHVKGSVLVTFGPKGKATWDSRWHVYDALGIGLSK